MLKCDRIDVLERIATNKTNASKECDICHNWYFLDKGFKFEPYVWNGFHDLMQKAMNSNDVAIVSVKRNNYIIHSWYMTNDDTINIVKNSDLNEKMDYIIKNEYLLSKK